MIMTALARRASFVKGRATAFSKPGHIVDGGCVDYFVIDHLIFVPQAVPETTQCMERYLRCNGGNSLFTYPDNRFGNPLKAPFNRVNGHATSGKLLEAHAVQIISDILRVLDNIEQPTYLVRG